MTEGATTTLAIEGFPEFRGNVDGEVFADKLAAFMKGLALSDLAANGERRHRFVIAELAIGSAIATVVERPVIGRPATRSGAEYYANAMREVRGNTARARLLPLTLVKTFARLGRGAEKNFAAGKVSFQHEPVAAIDPFFSLSVERILADIAKLDAPPLAFIGTAFGTFDGILKEADYRPSKKSGYFWLTAGNVPLRVTIDKLSLEEVGAALDRRARISGLAHYTGKSGLPSLVDVHKIETIQPGDSLARWRGSFDIPKRASNDWGDN